MSLSDPGVPAPAVAPVALAGASAAVAAGLLPLEPASWPVGAAVLAAVGGAAGAGLGGLRRALFPAPRAAQAVAWLLVAAALAFGAVVRAGALGRLEGRYRALALLAIGAGVTASLLLGAVLLAVQPGPRGALVERLPPGPRRGLFAALALVGVALVPAEFALPVLTGYPALREALVAAAWLLLTLAVERALPRPRAAGAAMSVLAVALVAGGLAGALVARDERFAPLASGGPSAVALELLRRGSDVDGDGSSSLFGGTDCAPLDGAVHPRARELPGNGKDDNCQHGDARPAAPREVAAASVAAGPPAVDLVLVTVDALRADHTSVYGYARDTTPNLARLAREGLVFDQAMTSGGWTALAIPTLLRGRQARSVEWELRRYRVRDHQQGSAEHPVYVDYVPPVPAASEQWTLPGALTGRGYRTVATLSAWLGPLAPALQVGFEQAAMPAALGDSAVTDLALAALRGSAPDRPFFLWVHYYSPHDPFERHEGVPVYGARLADGYDHEIRATDLELGRLLAGLSELSSRERLVVVASDHGETLSERVQWHGNDTCDESIRIPLVVAGPGARAGRSATPASLVDVAPTLLAAAGAERPPWLDGHDLRALPEGRVVITDLWRHDPAERVFLDHAVVTGARQRIVRDRLKGITTLHAAAPGPCPPPALEGEPDPGLLEALGAYEERATSGPR